MRHSHTSSKNCFIICNLASYLDVPLCVHADLGPSSKHAFVSCTDVRLPSKDAIPHHKQ